jgi:glycolate oxidase FAD binding subunit
LCIVGGNSKSFYGRDTEGRPVSISDHSGIVKYEPTELVLTVRAGTTLNEIELALGKYEQFLPFEPPRYTSTTTLGGVVASGLAGPARPYRGSVRDYILGIKCLTGHGETLKFGGEVMKNVAGFDASRLMAGALGTLGIILDITLKVLPRPKQQSTLVFECQPDEALTRMNRWAGKPLPISAAAYYSKILYLRLSGTDAGIDAAHSQLGGDMYQDGVQFWHDIRDHRHAFFQGDEPLYRISVPAASPVMKLNGHWMVDWGGAQRWLKSNIPIEDVRRAADSVGGHATIYRGGDRKGDVFQPLPPGMQAIHKNLKTAFDPYGIMNHGRLYPGL